MDGLLRDLRFAVRKLPVSSGFTAVCVFTIALGIGATMGVFSIVNGVLLSRLPYDESDRLVAVYPRFLPASGYDFPVFPLSTSVHFDFRNEVYTFKD